MKKVFGISLTLALVAALLMGCGGKGTSTTTSQSGTTTSAAATSSKPATTTSASPTTSLTGAPPSTTPTTTAPVTTPKTTTTAAATTTASAGSDFASILGKASAISSFYCEIKVTSPDGTQTMKEWLKSGNPAKFRMEITAAGQTTIMISDGQNYYMMLDANTAYKMSATLAQQYSSESGNASSATQYNPVFMGSETVNGVDCYVYQYTVQGVTAKMWLSKSNGMTIRIVSGTTTMDYTNYSFAAIADSMFTLPAGVMMITMPGF